MLDSKIEKALNKQINHEMAAAYNYFAMFLVARAMEKAGTVKDAKAIRAAIPEALKEVETNHNPYEVQSITDSGNLAVDVEIAEVVDGKVELRRVSDIETE